MNAMRLAVILALLPCVAGCGVIFGGTRQAVRVTSSPENAAVVTMPETVEYKTPTNLSLERKTSHVLTFSMPGYASQKVEIQRNMRGGILAADILLTGLIGVIVDAATGGWWKLSPSEVSATLTKTAAIEGPDQIIVTIQPGRDATSVTSSTAGVRIDIETK